MQEVIELIELVAGKLEDTAQTEVVVGQPIELGEVTIVPLSRLSVGLGGGGGQGEGDPDFAGHGKKKGPGGKSGWAKGVGGGAGMGAKVRPVGIAVFSKDGVQVLPIPKKKGIVDKIFDRVPDVIDLVKSAQAS